MIQEEKKKELMKRLLHLSEACYDLKEELYSLRRRFVKFSERDTVSYSGDVACWMDAVEITAGSFSKMLMELYGMLSIYNTDTTIDIDKQ